MLIAPPLGSGLLNTLKLSPATSGRPGFRLLTVNVPFPGLFNVPFTLTRSFDCESDLSTSMYRLPERVRELLIVRVPTEAPGRQDAIGGDSHRTRDRACAPRLPRRQPIPRWPPHRAGDQ